MFRSQLKSQSISTSVRSATIALAAISGFALAHAGAGCKDDATTGTTGGMCSDDSGGAVKAPAGTEKDTHCIDTDGKAITITVDPATCHLSPDAAVPGSDQAGDADAGADGAASDQPEEEAPARYGSESADDDCKYDVKWSSTCVAKNEDVTFTVTQTARVDGKAVTGSAPYIEAFLSDTHLAPDTPQKPKEIKPGVYTIGPIRFDASGDWTVKFHFSASCVDLTEDSPHGHVSFFVRVP